MVIGNFIECDPPPMDVLALGNPLEHPENFGTLRVPNDTNRQGAKNTKEV
jgi:hypothetical protein